MEIRIENTLKNLVTFIKWENETENPKTKPELQPGQPRERPPERPMDPKRRVTLR